MKVSVLADVFHIEAVNDTKNVYLEAAYSDDLKDTFFICVYPTWSYKKGLCYVPSKPINLSYSCNSLEDAINKFIDVMDSITVTCSGCDITELKLHDATIFKEDYDNATFYEDGKLVDVVSKKALKYKKCRCKESI